MSRREVEDAVFIVAIIGILLAALVIGCFQTNSDFRKVDQWAKEGGYTVVEARNLGVFEYSPFWHSKGQHVIVADLESNGVVRSCYFKFTVFGMEQQWKKD